MKKTLIILTIMAFLVVAFAAVTMLFAAQPDSVTLKAKMGTVTFPHKMHTTVQKIKCATCHHTLKKEGETPKKCSACHGVKDNAPKVMKAFHTRCKGCHKKMNAENGKKAPTGCKQCHVKEKK